ncbi:MAG: pyridoxal-phosphate dependent enzyme [Bacteroidales bacterium]|nr:pyridoxal-phosphate dependent enzyme [Bacteroidales bacterium]
MQSKIPTIKNIINAYNKIKPFINKTPVLTSTNINKILQCKLYFKCENFQKTGAFKFRGACNAVLSFDEHKIKNGFATHSSGNHAAALSLAAKLRKTNAYIAIPDNAPKIKTDAVLEYGGKIFYCKPSLEAREEKLKEIIYQTNATFIHSYNNFNVISGQGTVAYELFNEIPELDIVIAPVGGGGLLSGTSIVMKSLKKNIIVFGAEPKNADDAYQSLIAKKIIPSNNPKTIADGLLTSLCPLTFKIILNNVEQIITVNENSIILCMKMILERMKIIIEPSAAVAVAAILENPSIFKNKSVGVIISGGNVELSKLPFFDN